MSIRSILPLLVCGVVACDETPRSKSDSAADLGRDLITDSAAELWPGDGRPAEAAAGDAVAPRADSLPTTDAAPGDAVARNPDAAPPKVWVPAPGTTWHWQLSGTLDTSVNAQMYDIDLFETPATTIAALKAQGRVVVCYFSAGSYEAYRPDAKDFPQAVLGNKMDGWNELWIDIRAPAVRTIMAKRLDLAQSKGCDGVEPDNVEGYDNSSGFPLTAQDQLDFNTWLAQQSHLRGLSVGLKNDHVQAKALQPHFDWALTEECLLYSECALLQPFIQAGKAVFHVEYPPATKATVCAQTQPLGFSSMIKKLDLDAWFEACWN